MADTHAARELHLFIDNDGDLYRQQYQPILKNLATKQAKGVYDKGKAIKLWMYLVENGAKKYVREFGGGEWNRVFDKETRLEVARLLNEHFLEEYALGAYGSLLPKKYQPKEVRHAIQKLKGGKCRHASVTPKPKKRASVSVSLAAQRARHVRKLHRLRAWL